MPERDLPYDREFWRDSLKFQKRTAAALEKIADSIYVPLRQSETEEQEPEPTLLDLLLDLVNRGMHIQIGPARHAEFYARLLNYNGVESRLYEGNPQETISKLYLDTARRYNFADKADSSK